ncbi:hypothetical protein [Arenimonas sp.]|uniref:hypothetical protein n=1 Tax=Arenimonas sp. TaxID=1872635 RepID=UPI0039E5F53C
MDNSDYWSECVAIAAEECGATLTAEQIEHIAGSVEGAHENYGMAFYQPPASDRIGDIERDWRKKLDDLQREFDAYRNGSESAMRRALGERSSSNISIDSEGRVFRHDGRTEQLL